MVLLDFIICESKAEKSLWLAECTELSLFTLRWWENVLCFSHITFRLMTFSRSDPGSGLAYLRQRFVPRCHLGWTATVVDVRLVIDRAAERDRQRKGGEQGRERAWPR